MITTPISQPARSTCSRDATLSDYRFRGCFAPDRLAVCLRRMTDDKQRPKKGYVLALSSTLVAIATGCCPNLALHGPAKPRHESISAYAGAFQLLNTSALLSHATGPSVYPQYILLLSTICGEYSLEDLPRTAGTRFASQEHFETESAPRRSGMHAEARRTE